MVGSYFTKKLCFVYIASTKELIPEHASRGALPWIESRELQPVIEATASS
jgi:hypothetical protein